MALAVKTFTLGAFSVHNYVLYDTDTREAVLIDSGYNPQAILTFLTEHNLTLSLWLYTHTHVDHLEGHGSIREVFPDIPAYVHAEEQFWIDRLQLSAETYGLPTPKEPYGFVFIEPGHTFTLTNMTIESRFCPGHTPGGLSFYVPEGPFVFTGDSLFQNSIGRTDFPRGDYDTLMTSITQQLLTLPDDTVVYSGHGDETTIGDERRHNPFILSYLAQCS